jgi:hypothetical protein
VGEERGAEGGMKSGTWKSDAQRKGRASSEKECGFISFCIEFVFFPAATTFILFLEVGLRLHSHQNQDFSTLLFFRNCSFISLLAFRVCEVAGTALCGVSGFF